MSLPKLASCPHGLQQRQCTCTNGLLRLATLKQPLSLESRRCMERAVSAVVAKHLSACCACCAVYASLLTLKQFNLTRKWLATCCPTQSTSQTQPNRLYGFCSAPHGHRKVAPRLRSLSHCGMLLKTLWYVLTSLAHPLTLE